MVEIRRDSAVRLVSDLMQRMASAILVLNTSGIITFANPVAADLLGASSDALVSQPGKRFLPEALLKLSGHLQQRETAVHDINGRAIPVSLSMTPIKNGSDNWKLIAMTNLAEVQRANDALYHTQRLAGVGTLTASVAHELTNPLSIITATCSNLIHEVDSDNLDAEMLLHYIHMIEQSAWRSARIVEVLRHYTHDAGLQTAVTSLNMIIEDALTLMKPQFVKEYNVSIHTDLAQDLPSIVCDHNRITQVLINLLGNARDAMQPDAGAVHVKTWAMPPNQAQAGGQLAFSVRDEGPGIPPALLEQIFEPFFTTKPSGTGTGLGLFIARELVEQHNGRIWAENHPDGGALFTVVLPQKQ
ncbi:MAG: PAS domain-containing protein [Ardenticatenaceae bacterium]|nr:PAS domain-containing protein [Ardenticatenaceae bacterium]MCB9005548.1 PAS domain-containing protein [Ardenticatenaceae bacterium]